MRSPCHFLFFRLDLCLNLCNHFRELFFAFLARFRVDIVAFPLSVGVGRCVPSLVEVVVYHRDTARPGFAYFRLVRREFDWCGYIDSGIIPKFAGCTNGVQWFKDRGQWIDNSATPSPGMIIFFDWNNKGSSGPQDGLSDHVGIVERVEDGIIYTIEGNSGDSCRENHYAVGHYEILGYGVPAH